MIRYTCRVGIFLSIGILLFSSAFARAGAFQKPYVSPAVERENTFAFTEKPTVKSLGNDRYEITFAVKANCDVTVGIVDDKGVVVRHLANGVLGSNAPSPFQKNALKQKIHWDGKDDLDVYVKDLSKIKVNVMLGIKPVFDKNLGNNSGYDIPGWVQGLAIDADGAYVFSKGHKNRMYLRKFSHDAKYVATLSPPPANLPESKLEGMGYVEYEPGKKAIHSHDALDTVTRNGSYLSMLGGSSESCQAVCVNGRIYYINDGMLRPSCLYYINNDGSTELAGTTHRKYVPGKAAHETPILAASPDGKWIYMVDAGIKKKKNGNAVVWRCSTTDREPAKPFIGNPSKPGSDNTSFNGPAGIACDTKGRIFVCDRYNNRIQIFKPDGSFLKSVRFDRPEWIGIHHKTGAFYVLSPGTLKKGFKRQLTKLSAFPEMKILFKQDGVASNLAVLDSWSKKPRIWAAVAGEKAASPRFTIRIWEEQGKGFKMVSDFHQKAQKIAGANSKDYWHGSIRNKLATDGKRERVYIAHNGWFSYDLPTGKLIEYVSDYGTTEDVDFDKKGYMHHHFNPGFNQRGVARFDPTKPIKTEVQDFPSLQCKKVKYAEIPYDYGILGKGKYGLTGILDVRDQPGSKYFQDGMGVNMRGDVAEECNIWFAPKFDDITKDMIEGAYGRKTVDDAVARGRGMGSYTSVMSYAQFKNKIEAQEKSGVVTAYMPRLPGVPITGATIWTFRSSGELKDEFAVIAGNLINGVRIDSDGQLYYTVNRQRLYENRTIFLARNQGVFGKASIKKHHPFTGSYVKSRGSKVRVLVEKGKRAPIPLDQKPDRPPELGGYGTAPKSDKPKEACWLDGAEWFYAGASPIVVSQPCSCYTMRCALDWYKRSYVLEQYRHSIAILDPNGNLVMHLGTYGNFDSGNGAKSKIPVGGDNIAMNFVENVTASDNYICFEDQGERLTVLKITYHAEATASIPHK